MADQVRFVSPVERALFLKSLPPLREINTRELVELALRVRERSFRKGATLLKAGEPVITAHLIVDGQVRVLGGERVDETIAGPGEAVGLLSLYARWEEGLEAVAETDTITLEVDVEDVQDIFEDNFSIYATELRQTARFMLQERMSAVHGELLTREGVDQQEFESDLDLIGRLRFFLEGLNYPRANMDVMVQMASSAVEQRYEVGQTIWEMGESSGHFQVIVSGTVYCELPDDRYFRAGVGYPLGNIESLCGEPRWYRAKTETPVVSLRSETDQLFDLLEDHFAMAMDFLSGIASNLLRTRSQRTAALLRRADQVVALPKPS